MIEIEIESESIRPNKLCVSKKCQFNIRLLHNNIHRREAKRKFEKIHGKYLDHHSKYTRAAEMVYQWQGNCLKSFNTNCLRWTPRNCEKLYGCGWATFWNWATCWSCGVVNCIWFASKPLVEGPSKGLGSGPDSSLEKWLWLLTHNGKKERQPRVV